jgi:hypothetical protein
MIEVSSRGIDFSSQPLTAVTVVNNSQSGTTKTANNQ